MHWAITTMAAVGCGDTTPKADLGRVIASDMMLLGRGTPAAPTGIGNAEFTARMLPTVPTTRSCHACLREGHAPGASFRQDCGARLPPWHDAASRK